MAKRLNSCTAYNCHMKREALFNKETVLFHSNEVKTYHSMTERVNTCTVYNCRIKKRSFIQYFLIYVQFTQNKYLKVLPLSYIASKSERSKCTQYDTKTFLS